MRGGTGGPTVAVDTAVKSNLTGFWPPGDDITDWGDSAASLSASGLESTQSSWLVSRREVWEIHTMFYRLPQTQTWVYKSLLCLSITPCFRLTGRRHRGSWGVE